MSLSTEDRFDQSASVIAAEETLRLLAKLPAPDGLEDRVKAGLRSAPRRGMVIAWPLSSAGWVHSMGMRAAAAAAIVLAVAGGGWGVYSHIQVAPVPSALVEPQLPNGAGRFSTAGAVRVPQTVEGPTVAAPVIEREKHSSQIEKEKATKKGKAHAGAAKSGTQGKTVD
jgi:hypothetical protein